MENKKVKTVFSIDFFSRIFKLSNLKFYGNHIDCKCLIDKHMMTQIVRITFTNTDSFKKKLGK